MTGPHTDDDLGRLLVATFATREPTADPDVARRVAAEALARPTVSRRRAVHLVPAAVILLVLGVGGVALSRDRVEPAPTHSPAATPATYAAHRALAAAESARVVELTPVPGGARRLAVQPDDWPQDVGMTLGPADLTLTRTAWWSVPAAAGTVEAHLVSHVPAGMTREDGVGGGPSGIRDLTYVRAPADPDAMTGVSLLVQWLQVGDRTLVRADTFTAARAVRSAASYVGPDVYAAEVDQVAGGRGRMATVRLDPAQIDTVVRAFDGLPASVQPLGGISCPAPPTPQPALTLTFHTPTGTVRAHLRTLCLGQVEVTRDGTHLTPSLDPQDLAWVVQVAINGPY